MHRRDFLATSAAALAGAALMGPAARAAPPAVPERLGVQLYTLRSIFPGDFIGVLEALHRMGYREVEFAGYHDRDPQAVGHVLRDIGMTAPSAHVPLQALRQDLDQLLDDAEAVGHRWLVLPYLDGDDRPTSADGYRRLTEELNGIGRRMAARGVRLAYHNHEFEFETFGGDTPGLDAMIQASDPEVLDFELDLFWTHVAGHDPADYFERYPGRFPLWHVKDATAEGEMTDVGRGVIAFRRLFDRAQQAGLQHAFVEHDNPDDALESVRTSIEHLNRIRS